MMGRCERSYMLLRFDSYGEIDTRKLMDVYSESNVENIDYFYPDMSDRDAALSLVESRFLDYLKDDFFKRPGSSYYVLEDSGTWVSALRLSSLDRSSDRSSDRPYDVPYNNSQSEGGFFYLEALEPRPDCRLKGFATKLIEEVVSYLKGKGPFSMFDTVSKRNEASIKTHLKAGFRIVSKEGYDYLRNERCDGYLGMELRES